MFHTARDPWKSLCGAVQSLCPMEISVWGCPVPSLGCRCCSLPGTARHSPCSGHSPCNLYCSKRDWSSSSWGLQPRLPSVWARLWISPNPLTALLCHPHVTAALPEPPSSPSSSSSCSLVWLEQEDQSKRQLLRGPDPAPGRSSGRFSHRNDRRHLHRGPGQHGHGLAVGELHDEREGARGGPAGTDNPGVVLQVPEGPAGPNLPLLRLGVIPARSAPSFLC